MTILWMLIGICMVAGIVIGGRSRRYRREMRQLGTISDQWLAENRAAERQYSAER